VRRSVCGTGPIKAPLSNPQIKSEYEAVMKSYWQGKTEWLGVEPILLPLCRGNPAAKPGLTAWVANQIVSSLRNSVGIRSTANKHFREWKSVNSEPAWFVWLLTKRSCARFVAFPVIEWKKVSGGQCENGVNIQRFEERLRLQSPHG
jgi:hypothetical protein